MFTIVLTNSTPVSLTDENIVILFGICFIIYAPIHLNRIFEFEVEFPMDTWLDVEVWDYDSLSADDIIGATSIDLENRFFSPHRARCGLQQKYEMYEFLFFCVMMIATNYNMTFPMC